MSITSATRRAHAGELPLYPADASRGWRVIRMSSFAAASDKLARGEWKVMNDEQGNPWYFQICTTFKTDQDLPSGASASSLTPRESMMSAGLYGRSRTVGMSEDERISRRNLAGHPLPPEDAIERAIEKVKEFGKSWISLRIEIA